MVNLISDIIFLIITLFICLKAIGYGVYEYKQNNNKIGGICVSVFSIICTIFANIMIKQY